MNKRMREIQTQIVSKTAEAKSFMAEGENKDVNKANALLDEVDNLQKEFDTEARIENAAKAGVPAAEPAAEPKMDSIKALATAARNHFKSMNEGTPSAGGYTVPEDIQTKVNTLKEESATLSKLINVEAVNTNKGRRTYKTRSQYTGFTKLGEGAKIGASAGPAFSVVDFEIEKYAGYIPATNELLEDSDAAIATLIMEWLAGEANATDNAEIVAAINLKEATPFAGLDDIKKAVNVTLAAFKGSISILTNSDGLQYLDTLKDANERYLLSPNPANPMEMRLAVGATTIPVVVAPNAVLASNEGKVPFIVGDLREYVKKFDRKQLTLTVSDTAAVTGFNAFEQDMTLFRGIMRADYVVTDAAAIVRGELTIA